MSFYTKIAAILSVVTFIAAAMALNNENLIIYAICFFGFMILDRIDDLEKEKS